MRALLIITKYEKQTEENYFSSRGTWWTTPNSTQCWSRDETLELTTTWHDKQGVKLDMQKELESYCRSDVALLMAGCEAFVKQFKSKAGFNPFEKCATIASACNLYWRRSIEEDEVLN